MKKGKSLNYISRITNRNKSTLYYHYKKVLGKKFKDLEIDYKDEQFLGELSGLFAGDGCAFFNKETGLYSIRFFFNATEKDYVDKLSFIFYKKLNKKPSINSYKNVLMVSYYSKELYNLLLDLVGWKVSRNKAGHNKKSRTVYLKDDSFSNEFKIGFLRGFIDSDGYISSKKILFGSSSERIIKQARSFLDDLGFKDYKLSFYKDKRPNRIGIWHLYIQRTEREKFLELISPRNIEKIRNAPDGIRIYGY